MPSSTTPSSSAHPLAGRHGVRDSHAKSDVNGEHENVQRFRTLMNGKPQRSNSGNGESDTDDEQSTVEVSVDASSDSDSSVSDSQSAPDQEQALRDLLQQQLNQASGPLSGPAARDQDSGEDSDEQDDHRDDSQAANIGMQALHLAQQTMVQNSQQPAAATQAAAVAPALAELIERHVKQLLVPDATSRSAAHAREIMITLKDGLLPGTELWLSRTSDGWKLRADTRSSSAYRSLLEGAPQLIERFAQSRLGTLEVTPTLLA
ncbi:type III secretion HpaP family protein [Dyella acidiphila]|uniref:Flagellar hook-length control protein FliK n=1 Tax=Dyella acidiphila TaxID=2775866 RepID=A0ABR9GBM3_9GAMM|nr:type III secretion HpaP family protein [Dyella acidiphila]MBE1161431.1 hypothetical protein [Dyella acidiphila]